MGDRLPSRPLKMNVKLTRGLGITTLVLAILFICISAAHQLDPRGSKDFSLREIYSFSWMIPLVPPNAIIGIISSYKPQNKVLVGFNLGFSIASFLMCLILIFRYIFPVVVVAVPVGYNITLLILSIVLCGVSLTTAVFTTKSLNCCSKYDDITDGKEVTSLVPTKTEDKPKSYQSSP